MKSPARLSTLVLLFAALSLPRLPAAEDGWISLFNGKDLTGWTPKFAKHPLGENYADTFRVEDGVLKVSYDNYARFDGQFGHLYSNLPYSHYILRLEYRFTGAPMADAPEWAGRNSGVMIHAASPLSMTLNQSWPVSMEVQFLCTGTKAGRQTGNACTPGTHLELDGKLTTAHIIDAHASALSPMDEWVAVEVEVHGHDEVIHRINGVEVLRYRHPQLDPHDPDAARLLAAGAPLQLASGHIALQAESQPVWFRNIRLLPLKP
ncbi:MAG: 3-keto-disaccharide hydrolase [Verrucomicrobiota bacterium]